MIEQVLRYLNNYFIVGSEVGLEVESNGVVVGNSSSFVAGQYIWIMGTLLNDGIYQIGEVDGSTLSIFGLLPEPTVHTIHAMAIPKALQEVIKQIEKFNTINPAAVQSESLGDHSITYAGQGGWQAAFSAQLTPWKKIKMGTKSPFEGV